ncbi:hypothetical protein [Halostagnicola sp. A-GB9-2]|uniref:hypothetical protein n=1 Tax=Halostagnicola sp. A-GB9-2 TaxID=3048066 RepID=UPI0024C03B93|nr:hypothetical protein [Halostagnicola sp. A-GB9-2]MDJ1430472.1 hypothetical protein [Halostagnicola sp. A-GB9-2]
MSLFGDLPLEDVTIVNAIDGRGSGSIEVLDPNDEQVLDERFDAEGGAVLPPDGDVDDDQTSRYEAVLTTSGTYTISIELDEESEIESTPELDTEVVIDDSDAEHIMIAIGAEETAEPIAITVIENLEDITDWDSCVVGC